MIQQITQYYPIFEKYMSNREIQHKNIDKEISDITSQLKDLKIVFEKNRSKLITKQRLLLLKKKDKEKSNSFKVGQRVRIINSYSGDYGTNGKGIIGTITKVNKIQVNLKADNDKYYTRSFKNLELVS